MKNQKKVSTNWNNKNIFLFHLKMQKPSPEQNQIKNSKEVQNHISEEIQKDNTDKKEGEEKELSHSQKYETS